MQQLSNTLKEAIRGSYQSPLAKIEIINPDGSTAGEILDVIDCAVNVAGSRNILRNVKISLDNKDGQYTPDPDLYDRNLLWYNKKMKLFYGYKTARKGIRYIRDWVAGSDLSSSNLWTEISAIEKNGVNVALNKNVTSSGSASNLQVITDGSKTFSGSTPYSYASVSPGGQLQNVIVDLGEVYDLEKINILHFYNPSENGGTGRTFNQTKTEVSTDGVNWRVIFDSSRDGLYKETATGKDHIIDKNIFGDSEEWLPQGVFNINSINPEVDPSGTTLQLEGQDRIEDLIEDQFDDIYKVEVTATESVNYALGSQGGSASASSSISAGDEIQDQAVIHYAETFATVNGLETAVINETVDGEVREGTTNLNTISDTGWKLNKSNYQGTMAITTPQNTQFKTSARFDLKPRLDPGTSGWQVMVYDTIQKVYDPTKQYTLSIYARAIGTPYSVNVSIRDGNGTNAVMNGVNFTPTAEWKRYSFTFTPLIAGVAPQIYMSSNENAILEFANPQIEQKPYVTPFVIGTRPERTLYNDPIKLIDKTDAAAWAQVYTPEEGSTVTEIETEIFVDLLDPLQLQEVKLNLIEGAELTDFLWTSPDNATWTSSTSTTVTPVGDVRFIRFKIRKRTADEDGVWRLGVSEIQIKTARNFTPDLAIDGDIHNTDWRPRATDPDPVITFDLGQSRSINALYTYWGKNSFDFWNRVKYFIETSVNGSTWSRLVDLNGYDESRSFYGEVEHVFAPVSVRYVRINIKGRDGVAILRHIRIMSITASKTIRDLMIEVLQTTNLTDYEIPFTRRYVERKMAEIGDEKEAFLRTLARSANWDTVTDENGVYKAYSRNIDPVDYAWDFKTDTDNIFSFSLNLTNDIKNVIVVTYETTSEKAIVGRAIDDNPLSPTSVSNLGRRVVKYSGESYNSQEICDRVAQERLFEKTRQKHQTTLPVTGHPGIQVDDVVQVTVEEAKVRGSFYLVTGYETTFRAESAEFDTRINISQL
jgi:hypothetical protein